MREDAVVREMQRQYSKDVERQKTRDWQNRIDERELRFANRHPTVGDKVSQVGYSMLIILALIVWGLYKLTMWVVHLCYLAYIATVNFCYIHQIDLVALGIVLAGIAACIHIIKTDKKEK